MSAPPTTAHLAECLEASALLHPGRTAVVDPDASEISYRALDADTDRLAGFLRGLGVGPGDRVGILCPKSIVAVTAIFGILKCGAAYVPVDVGAPAERCRTVLTDCAVRVLVVAADAAGIFDGWDRATLPGDVIVVGDDPRPAAAGARTHAWTAALAAPAIARGSVPRSADDTAYILYTSGSTGKPKGVQISQRNATSFVDWSCATFPSSPDDRFSSHAPFHFDLSIFDIYVALRHGASLHLIPDELGKSPRELARFAAERKITVWYSTPSALSLLAQFGRLDRLGWEGPRTVLFAGEVFAVKHLRRMTELWTRARWFNLYGPTETNVCTWYEVPTPVPADRTVPYPIGPACSHCEPLVLDDDGTPVARGERGRLYIAGASVFVGYWNRPADNARVFREIGGRRYYDTGDVVQEQPDVGFVYVGRKDRMVKRRGYRIELGEVESALYRHPGIAQAAALAVDDGGEGVRIVACVVPTGTGPTIVELKTFTSVNLPAYMVPDAFVRFDDLPKTSTGKTDYTTLAASLRAAAAADAPG